MFSVCLTPRPFQLVTYTVLQGESQSAIKIANSFNQANFVSVCLFGYMTKLSTINCLVYAPLWADLGGSCWWGFGQVLREVSGKCLVGVWSYFGRNWGCLWKEKNLHVQKKPQEGLESMISYNFLAFWRGFRHFCILLWFLHSHWNSLYFCSRHSVGCLAVTRHHEVLLRRLHHMSTRLHL